MGCDIHAHVEVKVSGKWEHYSAPVVDRNYRLFARMAGVRSNGDEEPVAEPRGIPDDISLITRMDYEHWGRDAHTPSWLKASEVAECGEYGERWWPIWGYIFQTNFAGWHKYPADRPKGVEDVRLVFWFDN